MEQSSILKVSVDGDELLVDICDACVQNPFVKRRRSEIMQAIKFALRRIGAVASQTSCSMQVTVASQINLNLNDVLMSMNRKVNKIVHQPCTPKFVMEVLRIESQERARWTKDGRLQAVGRITARNSRSAVHTYAVEDILQLFQHPEIIDRWRKIDADGQV